MLEGYEISPDYAMVEVVDDGNLTGYLAIAFVDASRDDPPLQTGTKERTMSVEDVKNYNYGGRRGKLISVFSGFRTHSINRLHRIAGNRPSEPLPDEAIAQLKELR